eukprot:GFYU01009857.1.p1 GENE.GFYU01009857.1~~GFYU01009857.1.p1  ORF type:complete len:753 (-),score=157.12 GFYU01009857.1:163-2142(-)
MVQIVQPPTTKQIAEGRRSSLSPQLSRGIRRGVSKRTTRRGSYIDRVLEHDDKSRSTTALLSRLSSRKRIDSGGDEEVEMGIDPRYSTVDDEHSGGLSAHDMIWYSQVRIYLTLFTLLVSILTVKSFQSVYCVPVEEKGMRLQIELSTPCYEGVHIFIALFSWLFVLGFGVLSVLMFWWVRKFKGHLIEDNRVVTMFGFLYGDFTEDYLSFFPLENMLAFLTNMAVAIFATDVMAQTVFIAVLFGGETIFFLVARPCIHWILQIIYILRNIISVAAVVLNLVAEEGMIEGVSLHFSFFAFYFIGFIYFTACCYFVYIAFRTEQEARAEEAAAEAAAVEALDHQLEAVQLETSGYEDEDEDNPDTATGGSFNAKVQFDPKTDEFVATMPTAFASSWTMNSDSSDNEHPLDAPRDRNTTADDKMAFGTSLSAPDIPEGHLISPLTSARTPPVTLQGTDDAPKRPQLPIRDAGSSLLNVLPGRDAATSDGSRSSKYLADSVPGTVQRSSTASGSDPMDSPVDGRPVAMSGASSTSLRGKSMGSIWRYNSDAVISDLGSEGSDNLPPAALAVSPSLTDVQTMIAHPPASSLTASTPVGTTSTSTPAKDEFEAFLIDNNINPADANVNLGQLTAATDSLSQSRMSNLAGEASLLDLDYDDTPKK